MIGVVQQVIIMFARRVDNILAAHLFLSDLIKVFSLVLSRIN